MENKKKPRYTVRIKELEEDRDHIKSELNEHIFSNYMRFIDIFKEFKEVQSVSLDCYNPCFDNIKCSLKELISTISVKKISGSTSIQQGSSEWWQELPDEVDMLLADEKYEECIAIIIEAKHSEVKPDCVKYKLDFDVHVLKVIECIARELQKAQVVAPEIYIGYLKRLDAVAAAEDAYFLGKSQQLKLYMRRITITESPAEGIPKQCQIFVSLLRNTASESSKLSFDNAKLYSWITEEIQSIAWEVGETLHILEKIEDLAIVLQQVLKSFDALEQIGMSVSIIFQYALLPFIQRRIQENYLKEEGKVEVDVASELWKPQVIQDEGSNAVLRLSSSAWGLYQLILKIIQDCCLFYDDHLKIFASLVPIFLKTIQALFDKYINSEKFDDRRDYKIVQIIICNLWNLASLVPALCKKITYQLRVPSMELPDIMIIETEATVKGDDILNAYALTKWAEEIPVYLTLLQAIPAVQEADQLKSIFNMKHCTFIKEGAFTISSSTDRNKIRIEKYGKIVTEAYIQVTDELLHQIGGHYELTEINIPAFQQLTTDLSILNLILKSLEIETGLEVFKEKIIQSYKKRKAVDNAIALQFSEEVYKNLFNNLFH